MKEKNIIFLLLGLVAVFLLFMKKPATASTLNPLAKGSSAVQSNSIFAGSALLAGDLTKLFTGNQSQPSATPFLGGGSPSILNLGPVSSPVASGVDFSSLNDVTGGFSEAGSGDLLSASDYFDASSY